MTREIFLSATPLGRRAAIVDDGKVSAFMIESASRPSRVGDIHRGRVARVVPALSGGFVALGEGVEDGWLETAATLSAGQSVLVQIMSDARGTKGPRLGLVPRDDERTKDVHDGEAAGGTAGAARRLWSAGGLLGRLVRAYLAPGVRLVIDDRASFDEALTLAHKHNAQFAACVDLADREPDLFDRHDIHGVLEAARDPVVEFNGGRLVIESGEALTAIDIDVAGGPLGDVARRAMIVAAREIMRRNLGGLIVLDPPRLKSAKTRSALVETLSTSLEADRAIHRVFGVTATGLLELTRQRIGESVAEALGERVGLGQARPPALEALGHDILVAGRRAVRAGARRVVISASPPLLALVEAAPGLGREGLARWLGRPVECRAEPHRARDNFEVGSV